MKHHEADIQSVKRITIAAVTVIGICFIATTALFIFSYYRLVQSIETERSHYLSEVSGQIAGKIDTVGQRYASDLFYIANKLHRVKPHSFPELHALYPDTKTIKYVFADTSGKLYLSDGTPVWTTSDSFTINTNENTAVKIQFCSLGLQKNGTMKQFWTFAAPIDRLETDGIELSAIIKAIPAEQINELLTTDISADNGCTGLIAPDGTIFTKTGGPCKISPAANFLQAMQTTGVSGKEVLLIQKALAGDSPCSIMIKIKTEKWLLCITPLATTTDFVVIAIPLKRAAADTYLGIFQVILFAGIAFLFLALELMILFVYFSIIEKRQSAHTAAITAQSNFLSKMSHDIRTPLSTVLGMITLARQEAAVPQKITDYLSKAENSAAYLLELVNDILDINRIENGKMKLSHTPFSLDTLLSDITAMMQSAITEKKILFSITTEKTGAVHYSGDSIRIKQILMNLLSNAVKFTPSGGKITIHCAAKKSSSSTDILTFEIRDSGIGMSPEFMNRIFRPFEQEQSSYTAPYTGSGLGLSIVRSLTEMMGGSVTVTSTLGQGSLFSVSLPLELTQTAAIITESPVASQNLHQFNRQRILLAEDNTLNRQMAAELITSTLNLTVDAVADGKEAVDAFVDHEPGTYAAILLDIQMPVMNGLDAAQRIRAEHREDAQTIPILALSANAFEEDVKQSLAAGMNAHLAKPIDLQILSNELYHFLSKGEAHSELQ